MYLNEQLGCANYMHVAADLDDLTATGVHTTSAGITGQIRVVAAKAMITTAVVSSGGVVIACKRRPTYGSASGEVTLGSITVPAGTAAGKVVRKTFTNATAAPGDQIIFEVTTAAAGGGAAGNAFYSFEAEEDPEDSREQSDVIASA